MEMELNAYIIAIITVVALIFLSGIYALHWSAKKGYMQNLEAGARSIFTEEEPEGIQTDFFPKKQKSSNTKSYTSCL